MIVSASRRTDIPGYHMDGFLERLHAGGTTVRNPMNPRQERAVDLRPCAVEVIVFWTKHPGALLRHIPELTEYRYYAQCTVNPYPSLIEPGVAPLERRLDDMRALAGAIGPGRVVWRYDPILFMPGWTAETHADAFSRMARAMEGLADEVVISFLDDYTRIRRRLAGLQVTSPMPKEQHALASSLAGIARAHGLRIRACSEPEDFARAGIESARCIDPERILRLWGIALPPRKDAGQRTICGCAPSVDIGSYGTCPGGCAYCYARGYNGAQNAKE